MFDDLKQFVSSQKCLSCEGCCRFVHEKSEWRPKVGKAEEKKIIDQLTLSGNRVNGPLTDEWGYLKDKLCHGLFACEFFNCEECTCDIYPSHPFECHLYPFMLTRLEGKYHLSVHLACPYVAKTKGTEQYGYYVGYLKEYFKREDVVEYLKENTHLFGTYAGYEDELEMVLELNGS